MIQEAERSSEIVLTWTAREILLLTCIERIEAGASLGSVRENMVAILRVTAEQREQRAFPRGSTSSLMCACLSRSVSIMGPTPETCPVCGKSW